MILALALAGCTRPEPDGLRENEPEGRPTQEQEGQRLPEPDHPDDPGSDVEEDCVPSAPVVLNEVSPANVDTLADIDGDTVDWIELYNAGPTPVDLDGWTLSDDQDEPRKWALPRLELAPGDPLLVYASEKDWVRIVGSWDTRIDEGHVWRYLAVDEQPDPDWFEPDFDDGDWDSGPSGFGRGDKDDETRVDSDINTVYVRTELHLTADELADLSALMLHVDYDDGFVAYLGGVEVARVAMGLRGSEPPAWDALTVHMNEARMKEGERPQAFDLQAAIPLLREGSNTLALEVHNASEDSSDLTLIPFLTLGFDSDRGTTAAPELELPLTELHTSFALRSTGEAVRLTDPSGCKADELDPEPLHADESYGRQPDGTGPLGYFLEPTPGAPNTTESRPGFAEMPAFSPAPGVFLGGTDITVTADPAARVHTTWEGWDPTEDDDLYSGPLTTRTSGEAAILRARAFQDGLWPSRIASGTYLLEDAGNLPIVSIVTDPANLWDDEIGIYVRGSDARPEFPWSGANFYEEWERDAHVELWEPDGTGASGHGTVAIHGGNSRRHDQKNLEVQVRGDLKHEVFPGMGIDEFPRLVLRAGGGDWLGCDSEGCMGGAMVRDALMHAITVGTDLDRMGARPARVYLNGEYWGLYFINEKGDRAYLETHHDVEDFDLLASQGVPVHGDEMSYLEMLAWLRDQDPSDPGTYAAIEDRIDVDELQNYLAFQVFYANTDWPGNNIKYWRPREPDGRWRWLLYGTDFGLGLKQPPEHDTLAFALADDGDDWPNPPWSTELFRLVFENPEFTEAFVNRYADLLNTLLDPARTRELLDDMATEVEPEVPRQVARWGSWTDGTDVKALDGDEWASSVADIDAWLLDRPSHARQHIADAFGLAGTWELTLRADPPGSGTFELHAVTVEPPFTGTYFQGVPVTITAHPAPGLTFAGWSDPLLPGVDTITLDSAQARTITARFE